MSESQASFRLAWGCMGEKATRRHKHDVVSFECGNIETANRSSKQVSKKIQHCSRCYSSSKSWIGLMRLLLLDLNVLPEIVSLSYYSLQGCTTSVDFRISMLTA